MSLLPPYKRQTWKIIGYSVAGLILLGAVLFGIDRYSNWRETRKIDKIKSNVNATLANVANLEQQKREIELKQAAELENAKRDVIEFQDAVNATVQARNETNAALSNVNAARNSDRANVSIEELKQKLDQLDK